MLLDTSGLFCFLHRNEPHHIKAVQFLNNTSSRRITHNYVLAELVALGLIRGFSREQLLLYVFDLLEEPNIEIIWIDSFLNREAMELLLARKDKTYSLCDSVSFVLMQRYGITEALTTDRHFEQEGFIRLLKTTE